MTWFKDLLSIESLGSKTKRPGSLAGLHKARKNHLSQFFTPKCVQDFMWSILENSNGYYEQKKISILDNSCGIGSLFWNAKPEKHTILGCDIHKESIEALSKCLKNNGFEYHLFNCGMQDIIVKNIDVSLINPPFSINLESPNLLPYESTTYGIYGPNTSAVSHYYALDQALDASSIVIALVPRNMALAIKNANDDRTDRLSAIYDLPAETFSDQGAIVLTSVMVFSQNLCDRPIYEKLSFDFKASILPKLELIRFSEKISFKQIGFNNSKPTITLPFVGDNSVEIKHDGRKILLGFKCGLTQAKVLNAIYVEKAVSIDKKRRLAKHVKFDGQGRLDIELHLIQAKPFESLERNLFSIIKKSGGDVKVHKSFMNYFHNRLKKLKRTLTPFAHVIYKDSNDVAQAKYETKKECLLDSNNFISPVLEEGEIIEITERDDKFFTIYNDKEYQLEESHIVESFNRVDMVDGQWIQKFEGKAKAFPELARQWDVKAKKMNIHKWLTWDFQYKDMIEAMINPTGSILGLDMGLGKTRLSLACLLLSGAKHGLIVVKSRLVYEFVRQIKEDLSDYINMDDVNVINDYESVTNLKKINIISYSKLWRSPFKQSKFHKMVKDNIVKEANKEVAKTYANQVYNDPSFIMNKTKEALKKLNKKHGFSQKRVRKSYASLLRRKCSLVLADESHLLSHYNSRQAQAIKALSAKKLILLTGTPVSNYVRNIHPLLVLTGGDATAQQPWGLYNGKLNKSHIYSMCDAFTGSKEFISNFVTLKWVTHEFENGMITGAKREVPIIKNVSLFREMVAPHLKRRVRQEPEVKKHLELPVAERKNIYLDWDTEHLKYYLKVCFQFADAWKKRNKDKKSSLASILPRINAVLAACNRPFVTTELGGYYNVSAKERYTLKRVSQWINKGKKVIVFYDSPSNVKRMHDLFAKKGIKSVQFDGTVNAKLRNDILENDFKKGNIPLVLATKGCLSEGENLQIASRALFATSDFLPKSENQAEARMLRVGQLDQVKTEFIHLKGSIDCYQRQMCDFKNDATNSGLDFANPRLNADDEYLHMEAILSKFVEKLPELNKQLINDHINLAHVC